MYQKKCPECGQYTYSASLVSWIGWRCAYCGADISDVKAESAEKERSEENG